MSYRIWVNDDRTILVRLWENGAMEVSTRPNQSGTWGPPIRVNEEEVSS